MIYKIDCGIQSVTTRELREALKRCGFTGIRIKITNLGRNDFEVEVLEVVKPGALSAMLGREIGREEPLGTFTGTMDPVKVEIVEDKNSG